MKRFSWWPIVAFLLLAVPLWVMAFPQPPAGNTGAPGDGTCSSCHSGVSTGGTVAVTFPSGLTYTPGTTQHLAVTVNDTTHSAFSFQVTARLVSNLSGAEAGSFTATDTANTIVVANGATQDIETTNSGINQKTWNFDWTPPTTSAGNVEFYVIGLGAGGSGSSTSGNGIYTASYLLTPAATADFSLSASPTSLTLAPGASGTSTITVTPKNGFTGTVAFAASGLPTGVTASFSSSGVMTLTAASTAAAGTSTVTVTGTSGSLSHTTTVALTISAAAAPDFSLAASPTSLSIAAGSSGTSTITVTPVNGFNGTVAFTAAGLPTGVTASFSSSGVMTLTAASTAAAGTSTVTVTGTSGSLSHTTTVALTITAAAAPDFSIAASPSSLTVAPGASGTSTITVTPKNGFTGAVTFAASGLPTGVTASFSTSGVLTLTASSTAATGTSTVTVTGTSGSLSHTTTVSLTVSSASSTLTVSPSQLSFTAQAGVSNQQIPPQKLTISSSSGAVAYTAKETTQSGGNWLMLGGSGGTTPGTLEVSVNPTGLASGTYHGTITITPSGSATGAQMVPVTLTVGSSTTSSLHVYPNRLAFSIGGDDSTFSSGSKSVRVTSTGAARPFTASVSGGSWLTVTPTSATTPATIRVSVDARNLASGTYSGVITLTAGTTKTSVTVTAFVASGEREGDDGAESESSLTVLPVVNDASNSGTVGAQWLNAAGVPTNSTTVGSTPSAALALSKTANAPAGTSASAQIVPAESLTTLTELGFDVRQGGQCTATSPHFVVVTSDNVTHVLTGCANGSTQAAPAPGWMRVRFDPANPAQASPPIAPDQRIKSIAVVLDEANPGGGVVVLDNLEVNGVIVGKD